MGARTTITLRRVGGSVGTTLPKEMVERLDLAPGDRVLAVETEHRVHCMLELTAPPAPAGRVRPPLHLALVLDRSGSMAAMIGSTMNGNHM